MTEAVQIGGLGSTNSTRVRLCHAPWSLFWAYPPTSGSACHRFLVPLSTPSVFSTVPYGRNLSLLILHR
jgi:hypothetical protein